MTIRGLLVPVLLSAACVANVSPASAANVAQGEQLSRQWCATCHVLPGNPGQTALQGPPSFRDIARGPKTAEQVKLFLANPHGAMPPLSLSRIEIDALVSYIETLR